MGICLWVLKMGLLGILCTRMEDYEFLVHDSNKDHGDSMGLPKKEGKVDIEG